MAVDVRTVSALWAVSGTSCSATMPGSWSVGDFGVIFAMSVGSNATITCNSTGWTPLTQQNNTTRCRTRIFHKFLVAGDVAPAILSTVTQLICGVTASFTGVNTTTPWDVTEGADVTRTTSLMIAPTVTTVTKGAMILRAFMSMDNNQHGTQTEGTLLFGGTSYHTSTGSDGAVSCSMLKWKDPDGAVGSAGMIQLAAAGDASVGYTLALRPEALVFNQLGSEQLFMKEIRYGDREKSVAPDKLYVVDPQGLWERALKSTDLAFVKESRSSDQFKVVQDKAFEKDYPMLGVNKLLPTDKLYAADRRFSEVLKVAPSELLFLKEVATAEYFSSGAVTTLAVTDYLFLSGDLFRVIERLQRDMTFVKDTFWRGLDRAFRDMLLLGDTSDPSLGRTRITLDSLFLLDQSLKAIGRDSADKLYLSDRRYSDLGKLVVEKLAVVDPQGLWERAAYPEKESLYVSDRRYSALDRFVRDLLLLGDSVTGDPPFGGPALRTAVDQLFLLDRMTKTLDLRLFDKLFAADRQQGSERDLFADQEKLLVKDTVVRGQEKVARDNPLLNDWRFSERLKSALDKMFLYDSVLAEKLGGGLEVSATDKLFLYDSRASTLDKAIIEKIMLASFVTRAIDRYSLDKTLLADNVARALEKRVVDFLFLLDTLLIAVSGVREVSATDKLLLLDTRASELLKSIIDKVFLKDSSATQKDVVKVVQDQMLLADSATRQTLKVILDALLLEDAKAREILKSVLEKLLLTDWALIERASKSVSATDSLLLNEKRVSELLKVVRESVLLQDAGLRERLAQVPALDKVLLGDSSMRATERNLLDPVALNDLARKILEVALREGLIIADTGAAQWFPAIIEFLVWARLRVVAFLGVKTARVDLLGRRYAAIDLLGRRIDAAYMRVNV